MYKCYYFTKVGIFNEKDSLILQGFKRQIQINMKIAKLATALVAIIFLSSLNAKAFELYDAVQYNRPAGIGQMISSIDGKSYFRFNDDKSAIVKVSYATGDVTETVFDSNTARFCNIKEWEGFKMSEDESKILLYTDSKPIYRYSFKADYYIYELRHNKLMKISEAGDEEIATMSPDARQVAYVKDNNVYIYKVDYGSTVAVTKNGEKNKIINAVPDWVYQEEFGLLNSFAWSPDNLTLSFIQWDESEVPMYKMTMYEGACNPQSQNALYPGVFEYKYPVAGEKNSTVKVLSYDVETRKLQDMKIKLDADGYIPNIRYAKTSDRLMVTTLNRTQNDLKIYAVNPRSTVSKLIYSETSKSWIDVSLSNKAVYMDNSFTILSDKSGYTHLYLYSNSGALIKQLTSGEWNVTDYYGYDPVKKVYYIQTTQRGALNRSIAKIDAKGIVSEISTTDGTYSASFNSNYSYYVQSFSDAKTPNQYTLWLTTATKNKKVRKLEMNDDYTTKFGTDIPKKEFFTMQSDGYKLNGYIIKPSNFNPNKKYPVIMSQYSGPGSQQVLNKWTLDWENYFATQGYVVACVDGRGTGGRGKDFESIVYMNLGYYESIDQLAAAEYMASQSYVDASKIGIWGWSYGGYETLMAMSQPKSKYAAGVAIAPVTDWRFYDTIYAERYMRTPQENAEGYKKSAPLNKIADQKGELLIMYGTADDNVHPANSLEYVARLTSRNKLCDMMVYTNMNHSINGCDVRLPLYKKVLKFFDNNLK